MKKVTLLLSILFSIVVSAQEKYMFNQALGTISVKDFLVHADSMFSPFPDFSFNCTTYHLIPYDKIPKDENYKPEYLEKQLTLIKDDSLNPLYHSNVALYYENRGEAALSQQYYKNAYDRLAHFKVEKDSSRYYSYKGILKTHLGEAGTAELEKALAINPKDSIATMFYPIMLIGSQEFDKAKKVVMPLMDDDTYRYYAYLIVYMSEMYAIISKDPDVKTLDIKTFVDMGAYDKYFKKNDKDIELFKEMLSLFPVSFKMVMTLRDEAYSPTAADLALVEKKEKYFKDRFKKKGANAFGLDMALGTALFARRQFDAAAAYFEKAIADFPMEKRGQQFNRNEAFTNLALVHIFRNDYAQARRALERLIAEEFQAPAVVAQGLLEIAKICYAEGSEEKAIDYAKESADKQESFGANFLLAYLYARQDLGVLADRFLQKAEKQLQNEDDFCKMLKYALVVKFTQGEFDNAVQLYDENRVNVPNGCPECDYLIKHYLVERQ